MLHEEWENLIHSFIGLAHQIGNAEWEALHHPIGQIRQPRFGGQRKRPSDKMAQSALDSPELRNTLFNYASMLVGGKWDQAQDLVQEALLRYAKTRQNLGDVENIAGYIRTIIRNLYIDEITDRNRQLYPLAYEANAAAPDNVREDALMSISMQAFADALDDLARRDPQGAQLVILHDYEGIQLKKIAEEMQQPVGTIRSRHFRALHYLRQRLSIYFSND